jgi:hypothetical protein
MWADADRNSTISWRLLAWADADRNSAISWRLLAYFPLFKREESKMLSELVFCIDLGVKKLSHHNIWQKTPTGQLNQNTSGAVEGVECEAHLIW